MSPLKFSRNPYLDTYISFMLGPWVPCEIGFHSMPSDPRVHACGCSILASNVSRSPYLENHKREKWGGLAQWLASRTTDQGVPGLRPGRGTVCCGLGQVTVTHCSVLVKPRKS